MKKNILVSLFALFATVGFCQIPAEKAVAIPEGKAIIYIIRPFVVLEGYKMVNKINGVELKKTGTRQYVYQIVDPGKISVVCKGSTKETITEVDALAGKAYIVVQEVFTPIYGVYYARLTLTEDSKKIAKYFEKSTWSN